MDAREIYELPDLRDIAEMVSTERYTRGRSETFGQWHQRIAAAEELDRGDWAVTWPDNKTRAMGEDGALQNVQNFVHDSLRDHQRVVSESAASVSARPRGNADPARKKASVMVAIGMGYWTPADELMIPQLVKDVELAGFVAVLSYADAEESEYPLHIRLRPKGCYPTFFRREIFDMVYVERIPIRAIARKWPGMGIDYDPKDNTMGELVRLFTEEATYTCTWALDSASKNRVGSAYTLDYHPNPIGEVPIAFAANFDSDDNIEGLYDQAGPRQNAANRIFSYFMENAKRMAYAQKKAKGVTNLSENAGGPGFVYQLDDTPGSDIEWLQPAPINPAMFNVYGELIRSIRGTTLMPATREGEVRQSIASAAFIEASMGAESSLVREDQRHLAWLRTRLNRIDNLLDVKVLDFEKPLPHSVEGKDSYTPSEDIDLKVPVQVVYPGFGTGKLNEAVLQVQLAGSKIISFAEARRRNPEIADQLDMQREIQMEQSWELVFQKIQAEGGPYTSFRYAELLSAGKSIPETIKELMDDPRVQAELQEQAFRRAGGAPEAPAELPAAAEEALALEKGAPATEGTPSLAPTFAPPLLPQGITSLRGGVG